MDDRSSVLRHRIFGTKAEAENPVRKFLIISRRFFGIPPFRFYALADVIRNLLSRSSPSPPHQPAP